MRLLSKSLLLFLLAFPALARERYWNYCQQGGQVVSTASINSTTKVMQSYPGCTVAVYLTGTTTLAMIYSDNFSTPKANPFTADSVTGYYFYYADTGTYDDRLSGGGIVSPFTLAGNSLLDPLNPIFPVPITCGNYGVLAQPIIATYWTPPPTLYSVCATLNGSGTGGPGVPAINFTSWIQQNNPNGNDAVAVEPICIAGANNAHCFGINIVLGNSPSGSPAGGYLNPLLTGIECDIESNSIPNSGSFCYSAVIYNVQSAAPAFFVRNGNYAIPPPAWGFAFFSEAGATNTALWVGKRCIPSGSNCISQNILWESRGATPSSTIFVGEDFQDQSGTFVMNHVGGIVVNTQSGGIGVPGGSGNIAGATVFSTTPGSIGGNFYAIGGNYGMMIRNDGTDTYFNLTASGDPAGTFNSLRPLHINDATGIVTAQEGLIALVNKATPAVTITQSGAGIGLRVATNNAVGGIDITNSGSGGDIVSHVQSKFQDSQMVNGCFVPTLLAANDWCMSIPFANQLVWRDSAALIRMYLDSQQIGPSGVHLVAPTIIATPTKVSDSAIVAQGIGGQTADVMYVAANGITKNFRVDATGNIVLALPTSCSGLPTGALINNTSVVNVCP